MKLAHALLAGAALAVSIPTVQAADLLYGSPLDPIYSSPLYDFEGLYAGITGGGAFAGGGLYGTLGVVVGSNFAITDGIIAGIEFQGSTYWDGAFSSYDALALGRVGGFLSDNTLIYGALGAGFADGSPVYAFGAGLELAVTETISVRGELQGLGEFGAGPSVGKATAGLLFRF